MIISSSKPYKYRYIRGRLMNVTVKGGRNNKLKKNIAVAAEFYASLLMSKKIANSIDLIIHLKSKMSCDADGYCSYEDHDGGIRYFEIEIDSKQPTPELFTILGHEMVHLKQFATGEMKSGRVVASRTIWQGKTIYDDDLDYWDHPWEVEAYGRERGLFVRYVEKFGYPG